MIPTNAKFLNDVLKKMINLSDVTEVSLYEQGADIQVGTTKRKDLEDYRIIMKFLLDFRKGNLGISNIDLNH